MNENYGFSFSYPPEWQIELLTNEEPEGTSAKAVQLTQGTLEIRVEFKHPAEETVVGPGSLPDGQVVEQGTVSLLGDEVPKHVLVYEGKDKVIFVGERFANLELYIEMRDDRGEDYAAAQIPSAAQDDFDQIVASFTRTGSTAAVDPYPGWLTYTDDNVGPNTGFSFRYPPEWDLSEMPAEQGTDVAKTVELQKEAYLLRVQYKPADSEAAIGPATQPEGVVSEASTVAFLGQPTQRYVVVEDSKLKMIFLNYRDNAVEFYISLTEDPQQVAYADVHIPEAMRNEMDLILGSFQMTSP